MFTWQEQLLQESQQRGHWQQRPSWRPMLPCELPWQHSSRPRASCGWHQCGSSAPSHEQSWPQPPAASEGLATREWNDRKAEG